MRIIMLSAPNCGKSTQAKLLEKKLTEYVFFHIGKEIGKCCQENSNIQQGKLADIRMVNYILSKNLQKISGPNVVYDGFPRHYDQLEHIITNFNINIDWVIEYQLSEHIIYQRATNRLVHPSSGRSYNLATNPPKIANVDDFTGEPLIKRVDDSPEVVKTRLEVYKQNRASLIEGLCSAQGLHYKHFGYCAKHFAITVDGLAIEEVHHKTYSLFNQ